jgi:SAM-dependent methyltransferase
VALETTARLQGYETPIRKWEDLYTEIASSKDCKELGALFTSYGSDKSVKHNYYLAYATILKGKRQTPLAIWEIGIGTNDPSHASSMGVDGKPGASLRAFRDWAPHATVYGSDNDRSTLFSEERITTSFLDQTVPSTFTDLDLPVNEFDLIIDDGLHTSWANINTLNFALAHLKPDGVFVVEDILERYLPWWNVVGALLANTYSCTLVTMKAETIFIVTRKTS